MPSEGTFVARCEAEVQMGEQAGFGMQLLFVVCHTFCLGYIAWGEAGL